MKKKMFIILCIVVALLITTALVTSYADSARVRNSVEPVHTIKIVSEDGNKVTYWGLGYKVIRYPSVSPNEPYKNNRGVKYGGWFMNYELPIEEGSKTDDKSEDSFLDITENHVAEIGRETPKLAVEISDEDANALSQIINKGTWVEETTDCESDCAVNLKGNLMYYDSSSGTINKYNLADMSIYSSKEPNASGKSLVLSEEDRITVNAILEKYITLGIENN